MSDPLSRLRYHVSGAVERGEAEPIVEVTAETDTRSSGRVDRRDQLMSDEIQHLCLDHVRLHGGRSALISGKDDCVICGDADPIVLMPVGVGSDHQTPMRVSEFSLPGQVCIFCRVPLTPETRLLVLGEWCCLDETDCFERIDTCPCGHTSEQHQAMSSLSPCPCGCLG